MKPVIKVGRVINRKIHSDRFRMDQRCDVVLDELGLHCSDPAGKRAKNFRQELYRRHENYEQDRISNLFLTGSSL